MREGRGEVRRERMERREKRVRRGGEKEGLRGKGGRERR